MRLRPFLRLNMAMTADGKIANATRSIHTFGSPRDARHLYELRAGSDAILCAARTIEETGATLGNGGDAFGRMRVRNGRAPYPIRIVVSGSASVSPDAEIWKHRFSPIHLWTGPRANEECLANLRSRADHVWISPGDPLDLAAALEHLATGHGVRDVIAEGGSQLNDALFRAGLVDEVHLTLCPLLFGGRSAPTISDGLGVSRLLDAARFTLKSVRRRGGEFFLIYSRLPETLPPAPSRPAEPSPSVVKPSEGT